MTGSRIDEVFKSLGKIIKLSDLTVASASGVRSHVSATTKQFAGASGNDYDDLSVLPTLQQQLRTALATMDRVPTLAKATAEAFIRVVGAAELSTPATATVPTILTALRGQMQSAGRTIAPSGAIWQYFATNFAFTTFPTSVSPNVPDTWITTTIV